MLWDFLPVKRVLSENPTNIWEKCSKINSEFTLSPTEHRFSFQNKIKAAKRSHLSESKTQNLMTIVSTPVYLDMLDYVLLSTN